MIMLYAILAISVAVTVFLLIRNKALESNLAQATLDLQNAKNAALAACQEQIDLVKRQSSEIVAEHLSEAKREADAARAHFEKEAISIREAADALITKMLQEYEPLRKFASLRDAELESQQKLEAVLQQSQAMLAEAKALVQAAKTAAAAEQSIAAEQAKGIQEQAEALLAQATRDAARMVRDAEKRAEQIAGDAYDALKNKQLLEQAASAIRNVVEGYGDRYVIPTHSLLDDLALEFGYSSAGQALTSARAQSRRMVEEEQAATCDYVEQNRRETAIRFVVDAFNGRVDAILSRSRHDNFGTLEQGIRDAFSLVNMNGKAFRDAQILPAYLDARLAELRWAVVVHELARKQRDEQRLMREQMRDEEKARKEHEQKMREAAREEELRRKAVEEAEQRFAAASAEQKAKYEAELVQVRRELAEATEKTLTIAQQTKKGHVYVISNVGSFGEGVYKIGQTRRLDPEERIDELSDASVPFGFDIHAMIESENAPVLEHRLHKRFLGAQVNKVNPRKEFFRVSLAEIRREIEALNQGQDFTFKIWTEKAQATEYRESLQIDNTPEKKEKWLARQNAWTAREIQLDSIRGAILSQPVESKLSTSADSGSSKPVGI